jgi:asparagine synthase (glutamine-hydrolysing)
MSIPENLITKIMESKHVLKQGVSGTIPNEILNRTKQGFGVSVYERFFSQFGEFVGVSLPPSANRRIFSITAP